MTIYAFLMNDGCKSKPDKTRCVLSIAIDSCSACSFRVADRAACCSPVPALQFVRFGLSSAQI